MTNLVVKPSPIEHAGQMFPLSTVLLDGIELSKEFPPFDASSTSIATTLCLECSSVGYYTSCGSPPSGLDSHDIIGVRRLNQTVFWFHRHIEWGALHENALPHEVWKFQVSEYESILGGDSSKLPAFSANDIQRLISFSSIPKSDDAYYRIPNSLEDRRGRLLLGMINAITSDESIRIVEEPHEQLSCEIGLGPNLPAHTLFSVGLSNEQFAILLEQNPVCPFWITSQTIDTNIRELVG